MYMYVSMYVKAGKHPLISHNRKFSCEYTVLYHFGKFNIPELNWFLWWMFCRMRYGCMGVYTIFVNIFLLEY